VAIVLDASSVLAFLHNEPGAEPVRLALPRSLIGAVNWSEVMQKSQQRKVAVTGMRQDFAQAGMIFVPFTIEHAEIAAQLWDQTRALGLSLADRACLALALERQLPVFTADRAWLQLDLGLDIQVIR
jgi:ribonuclease VapC